MNHKDWKIRMKELEWLKEQFHQAAESRDQRQGMVWDVDTDKEEFEWIVYERQVMLNATNKLRVKYGLTEVTVHDMLPCERCATGHIDYADKYALYCLELGREEKTLSRVF